MFEKSESLAFTQSGNSPPKFSLMTIEDVRRLPPPEWLIDGILGVNNFAVMYGAAGHGKSFVALDMALSVAAGRTWQGHSVKRMPVVYIAAEGIFGIRQRVEAWLQHADMPAVDGVFFVRQAPQFLSGEELRLLKSQLKTIGGIGLIVIDTFARSFVGGDENAAKDVGRWIQGVDDVRQATGAAVLVVHHTGKPIDGRGRTERGSSALRGAADAMFEVTADKKSGTRITFTCDKQKDAEECSRMVFTLHCFDIRSANDTSCVTVPSVALPGATTGPVLATTYVPTLQALADLGGVASSGSWSEATGIKSDKSFQNHRKHLLKGGWVEKSTEIRHGYRLTALGAATAKSTAISTLGSGPSDTAATANTPIGVAEAGMENSVQRPADLAVSGKEEGVHGVL